MGWFGLGKAGLEVAGRVLRLPARVSRVCPLTSIPQLPVFTKSSAVSEKRLELNSSS